MNEDDIKILDGIETCEDKCGCGGNLRLRTHTFRKFGELSKTRHYIDCTGDCCRVTGWHDTVSEALEEYDSLLVSNAVSN